MTEYEEKRLQKIREQIAQMKSQETAILSREKVRQRKENTRRLIQLGTVAEKLLNYPGITPQAFEKILQQLFAVQGVSDYIEEIKKSLS